MNICIHGKKYSQYCEECEPAKEEYAQRIVGEIRERVGSRVGKKKCYGCNRSFENEGEYVKHMAEQHLRYQQVENKPYAVHYVESLEEALTEEELERTCRVCPSSFASKELLEEHMRNQHSVIREDNFGEWESRLHKMCKVCEEFVPRAEFSKHMESEHPSGMEGKRVPEYYGSGSEDDLYRVFIERYGLESWLRHVEMEVIQYVERARKKGQYTEDIRKAKVILERILEEVHE